MQRLLHQAGRPEDVELIYKLIGFTSLREHGRASALPVLEEYARDTSSYLHETTTMGSQATTTDRKAIPFAERAQAAIQAIRKRG